MGLAHRNGGGRLAGEGLKFIQGSGIRLGGDWG